MHGLYLTDRALYWASVLRLRGRPLRTRLLREPVGAGGQAEALGRLVARARPSAPWVGVHVDHELCRQAVLQGPPPDDEIAFDGWLRDAVSRLCPAAPEGERRLVRWQILHRSPDHCRVLFISAHGVVADACREVLETAGLRPLLLAPLAAVLAGAFPFAPALPSSLVVDLAGPLATQRLTYRDSELLALSDLEPAEDPTSASDGATTRLVFPAGAARYPDDYLPALALAVASPDLEANLLPAEVVAAEKAARCRFWMRRLGRPALLLLALALAVHQGLRFLADRRENMAMRAQEVEAARAAGRAEALRSRALLLETLEHAERFAAQRSFAAPALGRLGRAVPAGLRLHALSLDAVNSADSASTVIEVEGLASEPALLTAFLDSLQEGRPPEAVRLLATERQERPQENALAFTIAWRPNRAQARNPHPGSSGPLPSDTTLDEDTRRPSVEERLDRLLQTHGRTGPGALLRELEACAAGAGLRLDRVAPGEQEDEALEIAATSDYHAAVRFVDCLERAPPLLFVRRLALRRADGAKTLRMDLCLEHRTLSTYAPTG